MANISYGMQRERERERERERGHIPVHVCKLISKIENIKL